MSRWEDRPFEVANLLNPAFCGVLVADCAAGFAETSQRPLPYPLPFIMLPAVLHRHTRELLPRTTRTRMHAWLQQSAQVRVRFAERCHNLLPQVREGIGFAAQHGTLRLCPGAALEVTDQYHGPPQRGAAEADTIRRKAVFAGKWFALAGDVHMIYAMWGVKP